MLGDMVRRFRKRAGLTQQRAADQAGISLGSLRDLEQGRVAKPRADTLLALASSMGLSVTESEQLMAAGQPNDGVWIQILGPLEVSIDGTPVELGSHTQRLLLGALAMSPNSTVPRDTLVDMVWGDRPPANVVELLQSHLSRLRRRLRSSRARASAPQLTSTVSGYQLVVDDQQLDVLTFQRLGAEARRAADDGDLGLAIGLYREACDVWRGRPLVDLSGLEAEPAVVGLTREGQTTVVEYATVAAEMGRHDLAVGHLQRLVADEPLHEVAHGRLMIALAGTGQQAAALSLFDKIRRRLADELGADPGPELSEAHQQVLRQEITQVQSAPVSAHRQLPPDLADFTGRQPELSVLHEQVPAATEEATAITISVIEGMAGVGKTRLAVHFAHQLVADGSYRDVQLYVDLRGYADEPTAEPLLVLASFLRLMGVSGDQIPPDLEARAALYRDRLHDKHALVLLDNAADEEQVRPLLPAGPSNHALITSRRTLALDGARTLPLDVLTPEDAQDLLSQIAGRSRVAAEPAAAKRLVELTGRLPLAVVLVARRLQSRPTWTLAGLADRLQDAADRLGMLTAGSRQLRAVFDMSYQALKPDLQRLFRLLALHPGDDFTDYSAAALADTPLAVTRTRLDRLVDEHLITMVSADRYRFHDLLRDYAEVLAEADESQATRSAVQERVLDYYLHTADHAYQALQPYRIRVALTGKPPTHGPDLSARGDAWRWMEAELPSLTAAFGLAAEQGWPGHAWRLAWELEPIFARLGSNDDGERVDRIALKAAQTIDEPEAEAAVLTALGIAIGEQRRGEEALSYLHRALELGRQAGHQAHEMEVLNAIGINYARLGQFPKALQYFRAALSLVEGKNPYYEEVLRSNVAEMLLLNGRVEEALKHYQASLVLIRQAGSRNYESSVLTYIGNAYRRLGRYDEAISHLDQALLVALEVGFPRFEGYARYRLGQAYRELGQVDQALQHLNKALEIVRAVGGEAAESEILADLGAAYRDAGDLDAADRHLRHALALAVETRDRYQEARALDGLGHLHQQAGRTDLAQKRWRQAKALFTELGASEADQISVGP